MKIRKATKKDLEKYIFLRSEYIRVINKQNNENKAPNTDKIKKEFQNGFKKGCIFLVAELNGNLAGYILGNIFTNPWKSGGYIDDLYVDKAFRRKGIATKLLNEFIHQLKNKGIKTCQLGVSKKNTQAIKLYKKLGFDIVNYEMRIKLK
ncbi:MAG: GNAT family N-acetyltransferase [Candidatus Nanoarchaeia archaeon]